MIHVSFVETKIKNMFGFKRQRRRVEDLEKLMEGLLGIRSSHKRGVDLNHLYSSLKTSRASLENMLYDVVGMSEEEILMQMRRRKPMIDD